jgi:hypothetical protein
MDPHVVYDVALCKSLRGLSLISARHTHSWGGLTSASEGEAALLAMREMT